MPLRSGRFADAPAPSADAPAPSEERSTLLADRKPIADTAGRALPRLRRLLRHPLSVAVAGFFVGALTWNGIGLLLPCSLLFLALLPLAETTRRRWLLAGGYICGASWTVLPGAAIFYAHAFNPIGITLIWLFVAGLLGAPWALLCRRRWIMWAIPACLVLESVPPLAAFGIANPLVAAGMLFPHTGSFGLVLFTCLAVAVALRPRPGLALAAVLALATAGVGTPPPPPDWRAFDTRFGGQGLDAPDFMRDYTTAQTIQNTALASGARVVIFPESVVYRWSAATDDFWSSTLSALERDHRTLIVGAMIAVPGRFDAYRNVAVLRGSTQAIFDERIPMPISMWIPMSRSGARMNFFGPSTVVIDGRRVAPLICYEQLLVWPMLRSAAEHPAVLVGIANDFWAVNTYFPRIQASSLKSWGRLYNLPVLSAVNQ